MERKAAGSGSKASGATPSGERIAKVIARAGVASRRDAEALIAEGKVTLNGRTVDSPALNVMPSDRIVVDGVALAAAEPARLWLYHKPAGLVTSARDEKGRPTVFEGLPEGMPRVMPIGRLDLNSEGLLLLTNDGGLKRQLELPSTGWMRRYRVRVNGRPEDAVFAPLRAGITVEGEHFQPMTVTLDRQQGANAWLTVGLREGRNREVRRALAAVGLVVNRLIRIGYGPFRLEDLPPGEVEEIRPRVLRDQLGGLLAPHPGLQGATGAAGGSARGAMAGTDASDAGGARGKRARIAGSGPAATGQRGKSGLSGGKAQDSKAGGGKIAGAERPARPPASSARAASPAKETGKASGPAREPRANARPPRKPRG
jgi:23S rRNA pseudouridine2605 synthase